MKTLIHQSTIDGFNTMLEQFKLKYSNHVRFLNYLDTYYIQNGWYRHWCKAFQPDRFTNMETNNYVESWHNQLKSMYLKRKGNRRVDRLIYILVNDVEPDYISTVNRLVLRIGRMSPDEREARKKCSWRCQSLRN
ncbi:hypothetical protein BDB01DRAFT_724108 [Pilobolus umbonatus]|nr:hypothetical protein BDB01DRAFT_724108 [Pilobolus umbonatus]